MLMDVKCYTPDPLLTRLGAAWRGRRRGGRARSPAISYGSQKGFPGAATRLSRARRGKTLLFIEVSECRSLYPRGGNE